VTNRPAAVKISCVLFFWQKKTKTKNSIAFAGKHQFCSAYCIRRIRDFLLAEVEVVSCPAAVVYATVPPQRHGFSRYLRAPLSSRSYTG